MAMLETGTVTAIRPGGAQVRLDRIHDDASCRHCGCCDKDGDRRPRLWVETEVALAEGDRVEVAIRVPDAAVSSLVVFGIPLATLGLGGLAGHAADGGERGMIAGGAVGLLLGFVLVGLLARSLSALGRRPTLERKLESDPAEGDETAGGGEEAGETPPGADAPSG